MKNKHTSLVYLMLLSVTFAGFSLYVLHTGFIGAPGGYHTTHLSSPKRPAEPPKPARRSQQDPISLLGLPHPFMGLNYEPGGNGGQKNAWPCEGLHAHLKAVLGSAAPSTHWVLTWGYLQPQPVPLAAPKWFWDAWCRAQQDTHKLPWQMSHLVTTGCGG